MNVDKSWVRDTVERALGDVYGLGSPSEDDVEVMVGRAFGGSPVLQFPGFRELNPCSGVFRVRRTSRNTSRAFIALWRSSASTSNSSW